ncbi:hypothetical protein BG32_10365 [Mesotoga sp. HF07.pep.5.2.highcov]|nr:hypothetical protein [Thermotogota bacterium]RLL90092.1 hypothetical protein BG32_10365 [Mesotoga sp. HF07.pep.5.2.highcov]HOZ98687.1 hypothetical protein [Mesotoga prima]
METIPDRIIFRNNLCESLISSSSLVEKTKIRLMNQSIFEPIDYISVSAVSLSKLLLPNGRRGKPNIIVF